MHKILDFTDIPHPHTLKEALERMQDFLKGVGFLVTVYYTHMTFFPLFMKSGGPQKGGRGSRPLGRHLGPVPAEPTCA